MTSPSDQSENVSYKEYFRQYGCPHWKVVRGDRREIQRYVNAKAKKAITAYYLTEKMYSWEQTFGSGKSMNYEHAPVLLENGTTVNFNKVNEWSKFHVWKNKVLRQYTSARKQMIFKELKVANITLFLHVVAQNFLLGTKNGETSSKVSSSKTAID